MFFSVLPSILLPSIKLINLILVAPSNIITIHVFFKKEYTNMRSTMSVFIFL